MGLLQAPQYLHVATITPADLDLDQMLEEISEETSQSASHPLLAALPPCIPLAWRSSQPSAATAAAVPGAARTDVDGAESVADLQDPRWSSAVLLTEPAASGSALAAYATPWQVRV
jgi:ABC-type Fe3+ transport system substrate-binding protein